MFMVRLTDIPTYSAIGNVMIWAVGIMAFCYYEFFSTEPPPSLPPNSSLFLLIYSCILCVFSVLIMWGIMDRVSYDCPTCNGTGRGKYVGEDMNVPYGSDVKVYLYERCRNCRGKGYCAPDNASKLGEPIYLGTNSGLYLLTLFVGYLIVAYGFDPNFFSGGSTSTGDMVFTYVFLGQLTLIPFGCFLIGMYSVIKRSLERRKTTSR